MAKYNRVLRWGLSQRFDASMGMLAVAFLTLLIPIQGVECTPVDENSKKQFQLGIQIHPQATHGERDDVVTKLENIVEANKERWGVKAYYAELEPDSDYGRVEIFLENDAPMLRSDIIDEAEKLLPRDIPGVNVDVGWGGDGDSGNTVQFELHGEDMSTLASLGSAPSIVFVTLQIVFTLEHDDAGS